MIFSSIARNRVQAFGRAYDYDASYMLDLLAASPGAFRRFHAAQGLSKYRNALPLDAHFVARIVATYGDDCGACAQLNVRMALEAGVDRGLLDTLLDTPDRLPDPLRDVRAHVLGAIERETPDPALVARLHRHYGEDGFAELAIVATGSRMYPMLKRMLNRMEVCVRPTVGEPATVA